MIIKVCLAIEMYNHSDVHTIAHYCSIQSVYCYIQSTSDGSHRP